MVRTIIGYEKQTFQEFLSLALCLLIASNLYAIVKFSHLH